MLGLPSVIDIPLRGALLACIGLLWIVALVRWAGLRSFSKMTAFDFVVTLAIGSLLATSAGATSWSKLFQSLAATAALLLLQVALAWARRRSEPLRQGMENTPMLLVRDGAFLEGSLAASRVSRADVFAKVRAANIRSMAQVSAVVLETTGDISVLSGGDVDAALLEGVRRA